MRQSVKFHNGDPFTAEDVKFSFERYKGTSAGELKQKVKAVEIVNPHHVRFQLHEPWPDFMTFYATPAAGVAGSFQRTIRRRLATRNLRNNPLVWDRIAL